MISALNNLYNEIVQHPTSAAVDRLTQLLQENLITLSTQRTQEHVVLYRNIKQLDPGLAQIVHKIEIRADLLRSGLQLKENLLELIGSSTVPIKELGTIQLLRDMLKKCGPEVDQEISRLIGVGLGLKGKTLEEAQKRTTGAIELASWINLNKIPLADTGLSLREIKEVAPYLHYVDCRGLDIDESFISLCSNAYHLFVNSDRIEKLELKGNGLQTLYLSCSHLKKLSCMNSDSLVSVTFTSAPRLQYILFYQCTALISVSLASAPVMGSIYFQCCTIASFSISDAPVLTRLSCIECPNLTTLPLSLGESHGLVDVDLTNTGIDPAIRNAILNQSRRMRDAEAINIVASRLEKWRAFAKCSEDLDISALSSPQKIILNEWLVRMEHTKDFELTQTLLAHTVCSILADLFKNKEFQELFFSQAEANNACCGDRAAMSLNEIYTSWKIICGRENLNVLTGVAKTLRLRKELQKLIKGNELESVEIFLYYESRLRERLQLVTAIQSMKHDSIGHRDWIDQDRLVQEVEAHFFEELFELPAFEKMIVFDGREFSTQLEQLGECPQGDPHDSAVLNYQHRQGEIMQEWKRKKMLFAKQWYAKEMS